jgi:hypothetical protein
LIDCNDAIVHIFDPETRERYDLERLWRDAPRIDLEIEGIDSDPPPLSGDVDLEGDRKVERADPAA